MLHHTALAHLVEPLLDLLAVARDPGFSVVLEPCSGDVDHEQCDGNYHAEVHRALEPRREREYDDRDRDHVEERVSRDKRRLLRSERGSRF
jgi:hypothetical protein